MFCDKNLCLKESACASKKAIVPKMEALVPQSEVLLFQCLINRHSCLKERHMCLRGRQLHLKVRHIRLRGRHLCLWKREISQKDALEYLKKGISRSINQMCASDPGSQDLTLSDTWECYVVYMQLNYAVLSQFWRNQNSRTFGWNLEWKEMLE